MIEEIHGVSSRAVEESPAKIAQALTELQTEIERVPVQLQSSYQRSLVMMRERQQQMFNGSGTVGSISMPPPARPLHVHTQDFLLQFLRAERFDTAKAALRYCNCLNFLQSYFGDYALERELYVSDLNSEEMALLKSGCIQLIPGQRDRFGRRIIAFVGEVGYGQSVMARVSIVLKD